MLYLFGLVIVIYSLYTYIGYNSEIKNTPYFYPLGLFLMIFAHFLWLNLAKKTLETERLYYYGLVWDILTTISCYAVPIIFCGVRPSAQSIIGSIFILIGLSIIRN